MIEFSDFVAVFEAPGNEQRSLAVIDTIAKLAPGKPIRWVVSSHPHFDHIGGLRTYLHIGATIVAHAKNIPFLNRDVLSYEPRTVAPDIVSRWPPTEVSEGYNYEAVQENYVITDNSRILRVYYVQPLRHVEGMLMAYLPAERIAFQADLFDTHEPPKAAQLPAMRALATQVERMKLDVETLAPVHGPPVPWSTFERSAASRSATGPRASDGRLLPARAARRQLEHAALAAATFAPVLEDPELAVGALLDRAHAHAHVVALGFTRAVAVELDANDRLRRKAADQRIAAPLRELAAVVEQQVRRRDHGVPPYGRRRELGPRVVVGNDLAVVVIAVADDRIAVVRAAPHLIQLIAAHRPHLDVPEPALRVEREAEQVAMAERPDLRRHAAAIRERVVARHAAVLVEPQHLAEVRIHVLRGIELLAVAGADPEIAAAERDAVAVVAAAVDFRRLPPDDLRGFAARRRCASSASFARATAAPRVSPSPASA